MTIVWILLVGLGVYFGFWLGRRWEWGEEEERVENEEARSARGGIRLNTMRVRR